MVEMLPKYIYFAHIVRIIGLYIYKLNLTHTYRLVMVIAYILPEIIIFYFETQNHPLITMNLCRPN